MAWDSTRPVPWRRLIREWLIYAAIMAAVFLIFFRDASLVGAMAGLLISGPLYLVFGAVLAKFGYQRKSLKQLRAERVDRTSGAAGVAGSATADRPRRTSGPDAAHVRRRPLEPSWHPTPLSTLATDGYGDRRDHRGMCDRDRCRHDRRAQPRRVRRRTTAGGVVPRVHPVVSAARLGRARRRRDLGRP